MESPLRCIASDEYSSSWLKFHLGLPRQPSQRTKHQNQQQQRKQPQHLNTLGLRLNAAGNIKPTVVHMPSLEHRWKIHYSYKTKVISRPVIENPVPVDQLASQRNTREWQRSESRKGSPHNGGKERTRARSAASTTLARGREQRSPRIRAGTPELVTTTPIRLLGVLRSPENALNWRANDGQQRSPPRYFTFPPVTGSRAGATSLVRPERRGQVSTAPVESRLRSGPEKEDPMIFSRSSSSESLPSSWKYSDGTTTLASNNDVQDDPSQHKTVDTCTSTEMPALPTIDEEDAAASEAKHSIRVHISRNNSNNNRYNNCNDDNDIDSDVLHRRESDYVDEDSDSLSVYDDDGEDDNEEKWARDTKKPAPGLAVPQTRLVDNEGINGDHNYDHTGDQNGDENEDYNGYQNEDHNGDHNEDHNEAQNEQKEEHNGAQNEDYNRDQTKDYIGDHDDHNGYQHEDHSLNQNDDHNGDQNKCHNVDQDKDHNVGQNAGPSEDINEDQNWDQSGYLGQSENTDPRECSVDDYEENEAWTKEVTDYSPTQRTVYPPLTLHGRDSGESLPIACDLPTANQSHETTEGTHLTDEQHNRMKVPVELRETRGAGEVEDLKGVGVNDIDYPEELCERRGQGVSETRVDGDLSRGAQPRDDESEEQNIECHILKETADENNNVFGTQDHNEEATARNIEIRETSDCSEADVEDSSKSVARHSPGRHRANVDIDFHQTEEHVSNESKTDESMVVASIELIHVTDSQSGMDSEVHPVVSNVDDCCGQQNSARPTEKLDGSSEESVSLESTISSSQEERSCPPAGKAARKRSVRFSQDVATVYLFLADESDTSDSGFLSP